MVEYMRSDMFIPNFKTNVLPLRWFADYVMHPVSMWFFRVALKANDRFEYENSTYKFRHFLMEKIGWHGYKIFDYPYARWGTTYSLNFSVIDEMYSTGWEDYDENNIPYWDYDWHTKNPQDDWRLIKPVPYKKEMHENQVDFE